MTILPFTDSEHAKVLYQDMNKVFNQYKSLQTKAVQIDTLSMGMSGDYELAIQEGSTMIRVGSAIFKQN